MKRWFVVCLVMTLFATTTGNALSITPPSDLVTVRGPLEQVSDLGPPHFEVGGYVIFHDDPDLLRSLLGQEVVAVGTEVSTPSIYLRKALQVTTITPVVTEGPPPSYYGAPYHLLFGRLTTVQVDGSVVYYVYTDQPTRQVGYQVTSEAVDLTRLIGRQIGAVVLPVLVNGHTVYEIRIATALDTDIATLLEHRAAAIYMWPASPIDVLWQDRPVQFDQAPVLGNGRLLVGLRAVAEALGASVQWHEHTQTAIVTRGTQEVRVRIGSNRVVVRKQGFPEQIIINDIAPILVGGRTMVPIRVLTEGLGLQVHWDEANNRVELS